MLFFYFDDLFNVFETEYPFRDLWLLIFLYYPFLKEGLSPKYKQNFVEFLIDFSKLEIFRKYDS